MTERSHKTLVKVFNNDTVTAHVRLSKEGNGLHDSLKCTSEHGTRESSIQPLHKHRSKDQSSDATDINGVKSLERVAEKLKSVSAILVKPIHNLTGPLIMIIDGRKIGELTNQSKIVQRRSSQI